MLVLAFGLVGGLAGLLGFALGRAQEPDPPEPQAAVECTPVVRTEVQRVQSDPPPGTQCETELAFARGQLATYEGHPQDWVTVPTSHREAALSAMLEDSWAEVAELHALHCDEYPCIAEATLLEDSDACCLQAMEQLPEELERRGRTSVRQGEEGAMHFWVAFGSPERWGDAEQLRTDWRIQALVEEAGE